METKVNYAAVGLFVLALGAIFIAAVLWLSVGLGKQKHYQLYRAIVDESVAGLNINAPVKYLGVDVGKVHDITLDPANPQQVQLVFAIDKGTPIKVDTEAVLKTQGLTGIAYVELSGGSPDSPPLAAAAPDQIPVIRTKPSLSARLENVLSAVLANLDRTAANINAILNDENRAALAKILKDTSSVMSTLAAQNENMKNGIANAARTADNTAKATKHLDALVKKISATTDAVSNMVSEATQTSKSAKKTIEEMDAGVHELAGDTIPDINQLLWELNALSNSLKRLSDQTEKNPSSLLRGRQPVPYGPGEKKSP
ncbi:MAG TPA: MlaD family protein [Burkholderiaceae bacterium]|jgi:phospholipid/cholesterol/gamma-HCH transport system substrate-binding protein